MSRDSQPRSAIAAVVLLVLAVFAAVTPGFSDSAAAPPLATQTQAAADSGVEAPHELSVTVGKSLIINSPVPIERISVGLGGFAEARSISPTELLINGKAAGETSLIVWQQGGGKLFFDVSVKPSTTVRDDRVDTIRRQLKKDFADQDVNMTFENDIVFLRGHVRNLVSADRAVAIASTLGKVVNLLYVDVPGSDEQILLKVQFASVDRSVTTDLGMNLVSLGGGNNIGQLGTGQFPSGTVSVPQGSGPLLQVSDPLNIFLLRRDINVGTFIRDLQTRGLAEVLAEPNVLAINGKQASFVAGGEFPYPILQGGGFGLGTVTIAFREFGVRINFIPFITPRGSVKLEVAPEVSALDFTNGLVFQGFNIPALTTRRVHTEIELDSGQTFAIGGLLDRRTTETLQKMPLLADVPLLGKLFRSRHYQKQNSELLVIVTPERVKPMPAGMAPPKLDYPAPLWGPDQMPRTPGIDITGLQPPKPESVPVESLRESIEAARSITLQQTQAGIKDTTFQPQKDVPMPQSAAPATPAAAPPK